MKQSLAVSEFFSTNRDACSDAVKWASSYETMAEAWEKCERADWMLWAAKRFNLFTKRRSVKLAVIFAERVLPKFEAKHPEDKRPRRAIQAAKRWLKSPTKENQYAAAYAAASAAYAAASAATYAAYAAYAAADAASAAYAAADAAERKWQADKIRKLYGNPFKAETMRVK